jgi:hypothetical protein
MYPSQTDFVTAYLQVKIKGRIFHQVPVILGRAST